MKKLLTFLQTTLFKEVRTNVGFMISQLLIILALLIGSVSISKEYFDYRIEMEKIHEDDSLFIDSLIDKVIEYKEELSK